MASSANIKQEPIQCEVVPSSSPPNRQSSSTFPSNRPPQNQTTLINFSTEEASKLSYPVGCPVWYNFHSDANQHELSFCRGRVSSVAMDWLSRKFVYRILKSDAADSDRRGVEDLVSEDSVAYAMGCPVRITVGGREFDGEVVCSSRVRDGNGKTESTYSIMTFETHQCKVISDLDSNQVKYRPITEQMIKPVPRVSISNQSETRETSETSQSSKQSRLHQGLKWKPPSPNKRKTLADRDLNHDLKVRGGKFPKKRTELSLYLTVPSWALKNDVLGMFHAKKNDIELKVNCPIQIQTSGKNLVIGITSTFEEREDRGHSIVLFKRTVQDLLISHLNDDKSKGRLLFDLAKFASGSYRISNAASGAVKQQSIVVQDGLVWMQLVDIPFEVSGNTEQQLNVDMASIRSRFAGTTPIFLGVSTLCDPYVLIYGYDIEKVDRATIEIQLLINGYTTERLLPYPIKS